MPADTPGADTWRALGQHFYDAACRWAKEDGDPVEALVLDRFYVAAQDWPAAAPARDQREHCPRCGDDVAWFPGKRHAANVCAACDEIMNHEAAPVHALTILHQDEPTKNTRLRSTRRMFQATCSCGWSSRPCVQKWAVTENWQRHEQAAS